MFPVLKLVFVMVYNLNQVSQLTTDPMWKIKKLMK